MSNKLHREDMFIKIFRVSVLAVFVLVSIAGAAPFAYVTTIGIDTGTVFVIDTATNTVTATVNTGKYTMNGPVGVVIGPFTGSNRNEKSTGATANEPDQSTIATSNATEKIGVEEINLSSSEEKNTVEFNNSNNNNYNDTNNSESNNGSSSGQNESNKNNSTPGFGLLVSLACMYGERKLWKK